MGNIVIIGAGGNAKKIADIFNRRGIIFLGYISTEKSGAIIYGFPVLGKIENIVKLKTKHKINQAIISIGDNFTRKKIASFILKHGISLINAIHPSAIISPTARIGKGNVIMANAVVHSDCRIGNYCLLDTNSVIDHDSSIGDFSSVAPGAVLCGNVQVGEVSAIGVGATILEKRKIGNHCVIGGSSFVNSSIPDYRLAYGNPAKVIRKRTEGEKYLR